MNNKDKLLKLKENPIPVADFNIEDVRNYQHIKINKNHPLFREELVDLRKLSYCYDNLMQTIDYKILL